MINKINCFVSFVALIALTLFGTVLDLKFSMNIITFLGALYAVAYFIAAFSVTPSSYQNADNSMLKSYINDEHLPAWMDAIFYMAIIIPLAGYGHWITAICWVIVGACDGLLRDKAMSLKESKIIKQ